MMNIIHAYNQQTYIKAYLTHKFEPKYIAENEIYVEHIRYTHASIYITNNKHNSFRESSLEIFLTSL